MMRGAPAFAEECLLQLRDLVPYLYGQWLLQDNATLDYRVVAARNPPCQGGYDVAHRTGVIGQVFRTRQAIWVPDTGAEPLYDPFDPAVTWELTVPLSTDACELLVLNLEGAGRLLLPPMVWQRIVETIARTIGCKEMPRFPERARMFQTVYAEDALESARALAHKEKWVAVLGDFPLLARRDVPTLRAAQQEKLPIGACVFGLEPHLDLLATGAASFDAAGALSLLAGRYEYAVVCRRYHAS